MNDNLPVKEVLRAMPPAQMPQADYYSSHQPEGEVQLREYWRILIKYRLLVIAVAALFVLISLVYSFTTTPLYTAEAKLKISSYEPVLTATRIEDLLQQKSKETTYLDTQIEEIKSFSLADKVLEDQIIHDRLFGESEKPGFFATFFSGKDAKDKEVDELAQASGYRSPIGQIRSYLTMFKIKPLRRTSLVVLEVTADDPALAAMIANKHSKTYIEWVRRSRVDQQSSGLKFLTEQADEMREKVADLERELADYAEANSIVALNKDENITVQKMSQLNNLLTEVTGKRIETENLYKEAENSLKNPSAGFDDSTTQAMRSQLAALQGEHSQLSAKFTSSYPRMQQLSSQIAGLKKSIESQRSQVVMGLKAKAAAAAEEEKRLREELEQQKSQAFELSKKQVQYNVLSRELNSSRELLQNILRQIKETSLAVESNSSNISLVDQAAPPLHASHPRKVRVVAIGLILGIGAGLGLAFLLAYLDNSVRTPEQLSELLGLPSLGVVPSFQLDGLPTPGAAPESKRPLQDVLFPRGKELIVVDNDEGSNLPVIYLTAPKSLAAEAYRTIRTALLLSQAGRPPRTIMVSSAQSSEGKSTTTLNLAASLASAGGRVVLIDADLRRPSLYKRFGLPPNTPGLVDLITSQASIEEVVQTNLMKRIAFIPNGKVPPNPAELLGSLEMANLLDTLAERYDYVLVDTPPILPVADSIILSRYVDGVVLVVKGGVTPRKVVKDAKARIESVGARILGVVLNDIDITGGDYYYYNRYYYSYYNSEDGNRKHGERHQMPPSGTEG